MRSNILIIFISILVLAACSTPTPEPTIPPTAKPTSCADVEETCLEVVFTEGGCSYTGPEKVSPGIVYIQFVNQRAERARMGFWRLLPERSVEDWKIAIGTEPSTIHHAATWFLASETAKAAGPGGSYLRKETLTTPGGYVLDCFIEEPYGLWFAGGFVIE